VAVACGDLVRVLLCSGHQGCVEEEAVLQMPQQVAALALLHLPGSSSSSSSSSSSGSRTGPLYVAAGLWVSNQVLLQPLSAPQPCCTLSLGPHQPRSLAVCGQAGARHLVVGTSSGEVLWRRLQQQQQAPGGGPRVMLAGGGWARVGLGPVALHLLPAPEQQQQQQQQEQQQQQQQWCGGSLLAVCDQSLLLCPRPADPSALTAVRVQGGQGLSAACPLGAYLAYLRGGTLHIGCLDPAPRMRWEEVEVGGEAAPSLLAYHPPRCLL
jgi:hypothetical protein